MPTEPQIDDEKDIPRFARKFLSEVQAHERDLRDAMKLRLRCYTSDMWDAQEKARRDAAKRPYIVLNEIAPVIAQVETDIRLNPPGPICHPVGAGATAETADVIAGLIRQTEYASDAKQAYVQAGRMSAISGYGVIEWGTRYVDDDSLDQELYVIPNPDPMMWYFDPLAKGENREDALIALKGPRILSREMYEEAYGKKRKVLDRGKLASYIGGSGDIRGVAQSMFGWAGNQASINTWTSGGKGPFWVAEFWRVSIKLRMKRMYTDNVMRFDADAKNLKPGPSGAVPTPKADADGDTSEYERMVPVRTCTKYVVDALEVLDETEWIDDHIPALAILGTKTYIDGKLDRGSLAAGMIDGNRGLNYVGTSMLEIAGKVPRAPYRGMKGQFNDIGDDGVNKWQTALTVDHAWLASDPVEMVSEVDGRSTFAPPPIREMMEASIQWLLGLASFFKDAIQASSAYSATSLGKRTADQSGEAIRALQAESNKGTFSYPDGVNNGVAKMYQRWLRIYPKLLDSAQASTIITADGENEQKLINQDFPHPAGGRNPDGTARTMRHDIALGRYSVRVEAGPSPEDRNSQALTDLGQVFEAAPQLLQIPGVAAAWIRMKGSGNPKVGQIADLLPGGQGDDQNPQQMQQQNQQLQARVQQLTQAGQQLAQKLQAQLPKIEADKFKALLSSFTQIEVARIGAKVDAASSEASTLETMLGLAHQTASDELDRQHARDTAAQAAQTASAASSQQAQQAQDAAAQASAAQPNPQGDNA